MPRNLSPSDVANFRERLCDVATQLLAELGQEGFNMRELAARMGVSAMTTYRYFKDKNEILLAHNQSFHIYEIREEGGKTKVRMVSIKVEQHDWGK